MSYTSLNTEIITVTAKDSHTRIKPLAFASGHGRNITDNRYTRTDTYLRLVSVGELPFPVHVAIAVTTNLYSGNRVDSETKTVT